MTIIGISGRKSTQVWLSDSLSPHSVSHCCAGKDARRLLGPFLSAHARGPLGSVVCELAETPGLQERGSACAGALPALPRRCSHCPAPVRLRRLWAVPLHIRIGENSACSGVEGTCPSPGWTCSRKIRRPQEAVIPSARVGVAPPTGLACVCGAAPSILLVGLGVARVCPGQDEPLIWGRGRSRPTRAPGTSPPLSLGKVLWVEGGPPRPG